MLRMCMSKNHRGPKIFGIKRPLLDFSRTHGYCAKCFRTEMEEIEKRREVRTHE